MSLPTRATIVSTASSSREPSPTGSHLGLSGGLSHVEDIRYYDTADALHLIGTDTSTHVRRRLSFQKVHNSDAAAAASTSTDQQRSSSARWPLLQDSISTAVFNSPVEADAYVASLKRNKETSSVLLQTGEAVALLGAVRFTRSHYYYLVLATKARLIARIGPHQVFEVADVMMVSLLAGGRGSSGGSSSSGLHGATALITAAAPYLFSRRTVEETYRAQFPLGELKRNVYFSPTYDLTNTLQTNMTVPAQRRDRRMMYVWNEFLMEPFCEQSQSQSQSQGHGSNIVHTEVQAEEERPEYAGMKELPLASIELQPWLVHLIRGAVTQRTVRVDEVRNEKRAEEASVEAVITIIGRSSKEYAGARFLRRGVCSTGAVANQVEVEQIVSTTAACTSRNSGDTPSERWTSYVQVRGTIPLHWHHLPSSLPKPPIVVGLNDPFVTDTRLHFQRLLAEYGGPVIVMNYIKLKEKKPRETLLGEAYREAVGTLCEAIHSEPFRDDGEAGCSAHARIAPTDVIQYREVDLKRMSDQAWNVVAAAAEQDLHETQFFVSCEVNKESVGSSDGNGETSSDDASVYLQHGVVRSNCVDCIDRTNIGQFMYGLVALGHQLSGLSLFSCPADLALVSPQLHEQLLDMYLQLGDAIAVQYGGSAQVGAGVLHRGTGWDHMMGVKRLYNNVLGDRDKQFAINLLLGRFQPGCGAGAPASHAMNPKMVFHQPPRVQQRAPALQADPALSSGGDDFMEDSVSNGTALAMVPSTAVVSERASSHTRPTSSSLLSRLMVSLSFGKSEQRTLKHAVPVQEPGEAEWDYYLQVRTAPSLPDPDKLRRWWQAPLRWHQLVYHGPIKAGTSWFDARLRISKAAPSRSISANTFLCEGDRQLRMQRALACSRANAIAGDGLPPTQQLVHRFGVAFARKLLDGFHEGAPVRSREHVHCHRTFPAEVHASLYCTSLAQLQAIPDEIAEECCEIVAGSHGVDPERNGDVALTAAQVHVLTSLGDPREWDPATVSCAFLKLWSSELDTPTTSTVLLNEGQKLCPMSARYIAEALVAAGVTGLDLVEELEGPCSLVRRGTWSADARVRRLAYIAKQLVAHRDLSDAAIHYCVSVSLDGSDGGGWRELASAVSMSTVKDADPLLWATCRILQEFFSIPLSPSALPSVLARLCAEMGDPRTGVPRYDTVRFTDKCNSVNTSPGRVPAMVRVTNCFSALQLHRWLLRGKEEKGGSASCGLALHRYPSAQDQATAAWRFMVWLLQSCLIIPAVARSSSGSNSNSGAYSGMRMSISVREALELFAERTSLFYLTSGLGKLVLNAPPPSVLPSLPTSSSSLLRNHLLPTHHTGTLLAARVGALCRLAMAGLDTAKRLCLLPSITTAISTTSTTGGGGTSTGASATMTNELDKLVEGFVASARELSNGVDLAQLVSDSNRDDDGLIAISVLVNLYNSLYAHAWLSEFLLYWRQQQQQHVLLAPVSAVAFYETHCYNIGGYHFSLSDLKDGVLRGNRAPCYASVPLFQEQDPRIQLIPASLRASGSDTTSLYPPACVSDSLASIDAAALSLALVYSDSQHRGRVVAVVDGNSGDNGNPLEGDEHAIRKALAAWRLDVSYIQQRVLLALLDTYVAPPTTLLFTPGVAGSNGLPTYVPALLPPLNDELSGLQFGVAVDGSLEDHTGVVDLLSPGFFHSPYSFQQPSHQHQGKGLDSWALQAKTLAPLKAIAPSLSHPCVPLSTESVLVELQQAERNLLASLQDPSETSSAGYSLVYTRAQLLAYKESFEGHDSNALQRLKEGCASSAALQKAHETLAKVAC